MGKEIDKLSNAERELMLKAPLLVCLLIAGADNEIDNKEIKGASELSKKRKTKLKTEVADFLEEVGTDFEDKLKIVLEALPHVPEERTKAITEELSKLNKVLPKLSKAFASDYYKALQYIARKVAESSGGILGIKSVGDEEESLLGLPMVKNPSSPG